MKVRWAYIRAGCKSCQRAQEFLAEVGVEPENIQNAKKEPINADEAVALVRKGKKVIGNRGTKLVSLDLAKDSPTDKEIAALVVGPSGKLRAPTLQIGNRFVVGFSNELYVLVFSDD